MHDPGELEETAVTSVSIVVPTFQRPDALAQTLTALAGLDYPAADLEVLVVDDAADPRTEEVAGRFAHDLAITRLAENRRGAARARNAGARAAGGDLLLFLDDDMIVTPDHVTRHVWTHTRYPNSMVGSRRWYTAESLAALSATAFGRYRVELERRFTDGLVEPVLEGECVSAEILAACDLSVPRSDFEALGGFDDAFPHAGAEDQDLSLRARRAGMRLVRNRAIQPQHAEDIVTLEKFAWREERGAETVVVLARRFPEAVGRFPENGPVARGDSAALVAKKLAKSALDRRAPLKVLHAMARLLERLGVPEPVLRRLYSGIIALHIHRGYRRALVTRA